MIFIDDAKVLHSAKPLADIGRQCPTLADIGTHWPTSITEFIFKTTNCTN